MRPQKATPGRNYQPILHAQAGGSRSCMVKKGTPAESFDSAGVRRVAVTYSPTFAVPSAL